MWARRRGKLDRPLFAIHVGAVARSDIPILVAINPDVELVFVREVDDRLRGLAGTKCSRMTERSGRTNSPPLNAVIGSWSCRSSINVFMPSGGRPLVIVNAMPA